MKPATDPYCMHNNARSKPIIAHICCSAASLVYHLYTIHATFSNTTVITTAAAMSRRFTRAQAQYGAYFHKVLFSGTLQRQQRTKVTLRRVTFLALDRLLLHQQAPGPARGTGSPRSPPQHSTAADAHDKQQGKRDTFFLCVYAASRIVWHGTAAVEVCMLPLAFRSKSHMGPCVKLESLSKLRSQNLSTLMAPVTAA